MFISGDIMTSIQAWKDSLISTHIHTYLNYKNMSVLYKLYPINEIRLSSVKVKRITYKPSQKLTKKLKGAIFERSGKTIYK